MLPLAAKVVDFRVAPGHRLYLSLKDACIMMGVRDNLLLLEVRDGKLDCMGKTFSLNRICQKKRPETFPISLVQSEYNAEDDKIECHFSDQVELKIHCTKKQLATCSYAKKSCLLFKKRIAYELPLVRATSLDNFDGTKDLRCLFQSAKTEEILQQDEKSFEGFLKSL